MGDFLLNIHMLACMLFQIDNLINYSFIGFRIYVKPSYSGAPLK